jgi:hypothetical protein
MAATDYETLLIERAWAILEAHVPFTADVSVGNRIKLTGMKAAAPVKTDPASFTKVIVSVSDWTDTLYTLGERFNMSTNHSVAEDLRFALVIDIFHADSFTVSRRVVAETMTAFRKAGPQLGITAFRLQQAGPASVRNVNTPIENNYGIAGAKPVSSTITLPLLVRTKTSDMLA